MKALTRLERNGNIAVLLIDNPPVNALSEAVIQGLTIALDTVEADSSFEALLICCEGKTFVAGGDIRAFDDPGFSARPFNQFLARLEALNRLVVASLHGSVLGGGLELALACHFRVGQPCARFGFPEIRLGIIPSSLGTQRLPRLIGIESALEMITGGREIDAAAALKTCLIDEVREGRPLDSGLAFVRDLLSRAAQPRRISEFNADASKLITRFFENAPTKAKSNEHFYPAEIDAVLAVKASLLPFHEGEAIEEQLFNTLRASPQSRALRHLFFSDREATKIPTLHANVLLRQVKSVGVLGAGTMGGGIAMNFANAGIPCLLVETSAEALERGLKAIHTNYGNSAARGKLTSAEVEARIGLLSGSLDDRALGECDLVIEAVFEDMDLKTRVCARLGEVCKPGAIIATNTSTLDVDKLAEATGRPADMLGMHFFSPANVMRLLEVVRGAKTAPAVLATVMQLARKIKKVAVVSGVCYGFIGNRMAEVYMREAEFLLMEGASPSEIDTAVESLGMAMGPCRMLDMAGIDVGAKTVIEYGKTGGLPSDDSYRAVVRKLFELGRFGQKTGAGYYRYEGRKAVADPETSRIVAGVALTHGIAPRGDISAQEIVERLLYPLINEGARILEEGIAYRPGDIDVVWTAGYGFPDHLGGPIFMADAVGLPVIVERLAHHATQRGNVFGYWTASRLLADLAASGQRLSDWTSP